MASSSQEYAEAAATSIIWQQAYHHYVTGDGIGALVTDGAISVREGARQCLKEYTAGIDLLKTATTNREVIDVLSKLRSRRADYLCMLVKDDVDNDRITAETISNCRQQFEDATACLDLSPAHEDATPYIDLSPAHSTPNMICGARENRMIALDYLKNKFNVPDVEIERETKLALEDCKSQIADSNATAEQKRFARDLLQSLKDVVSKSISYLCYIFMLFE